MSESIMDLSELMSGIPNERIKAFVLQYAQTDERFMRELFIEFGKPEIGAEIAQIKERIRTAIRRGTRRGHIDYSGCDFICGELMDILDTAEKRISQGHIVLAFHIALNILLTGVKLASTADTSSGALTETICASLKVLDRACENVEMSGSDADRKLLYEKLVKEARNKVFDGWGEWNYNLLQSAARFITEKNKQKLLDSLDYLLNLYGKEEHMRHYITDDKLTRLEVIRRLKGPGQANEYIRENLHIDEFRKIAVQTAVLNEDYEYAEGLCLEKLGDSVRGTKPPEWYYNLFDIYEKAQNRDKQVETAETLLLLGDLKYYGILKELLTEDGVWNEKYPDVRRKCAERLPYHYYMSILQRENEARLLFEEVRKHPEAVFTYGKQVAVVYKDEVYKIYHGQIIKQAGYASDRREYKAICASIKALYEAGGEQPALALIDEFLATFARRPAMADELGKLRKKLSK